VIEEEGGHKSYWPSRIAATVPISTARLASPPPCGTDCGMKFGIDRLLADPTLRAPLEGKRVALVAHPASVTEGWSIRSMRWRPVPVSRSRRLRTPAWPEG